MKVIGLMKNKKGMELKNGKMVLFIKVNFIMGNNHILEFIYFQIEKYIFRRMGTKYDEWI